MVAYHYETALLVCVRRKLSDNPEESDNPSAIAPVTIGRNSVHWS